jgi:cytochrome oxidase assembly protein ShyY1
VEAKAECVDVTGVLRVPDKASFVPRRPTMWPSNKWYSRDAAAMARALKVSAPGADVPDGRDQHQSRLPRP